MILDTEFLTFQKLYSFIKKKKYAVHISICFVNWDYIFLKPLKIKEIERISLEIDLDRVFARCTELKSQ